MVNANGATTLAANGYTKIAYDTETFDVGSMYDSANKKFLPTTAGIYRIVAQNAINTPGSAVLYFINVYKNGSLYYTGTLWQESITSTYAHLIVDCLVSLNGSTDYIEIYIYNGHATLTYTTVTGTNAHFSANWVGPSS